MIEDGLADPQRVVAAVGRAFDLTDETLKELPESVWDAKTGMLELYAYGR